MGLERLQAGEREGTQAALLCGVVHTFFITIIKNSPKNTACTTHCVVHAAGGEGGIRPAALGQCRRPARGTKKPFAGWFFTRHRRAVPFSSLLLLCSTKKRPQMRSLFRGGEGGIRTLAPVTPAYSLSRGAPYSHLGTSPRIYCRRYVELSGGERGIRTPGALRHHWFSRPAP